MVPDDLYYHLYIVQQKQGPWLIVFTRKHFSNPFG